MTQEEFPTLGRAGKSSSSYSLIPLLSNIIILDDAILLRQCRKHSLVIPEVLNSLEKTKAPFASICHRTKH